MLCATFAVVQETSGGRPMPSRIVREGILTSHRVNALTSGAELFYRRLLNVIDDFGRYHGTPTLLRAATFPLKLDKVQDSHIEAWLKECVDAGLVEVFTHDGLPYIEVARFGTPRAKASKFPRLHTDESGCKQMQTDANKCAQPQADESNRTVVVVESVVVSETTSPPPKARRSWAGDWEPELAKLLTEPGTVKDRCKCLNALKGVAGDRPLEALIRDLATRGWQGRDLAHAYAYMTSALKSKVAPAAQPKVSLEYQRGADAYDD